MNFNFIKSIAATTALFTFVACSNDDDGNNGSRIGYADLPETSKNLIATNFSDAEAKSVTKKDVPDTDGTVYEVHLNNNYEIDFNAQGDLTDISGNNQKLPDGVVLPAILQYVLDNYPSDVYIDEMDREPFGYEVELSNDVELYFDVDGNFISQDVDNDDDDEITVPVSDLPQNARTLIESHFSGAQAIYLSKNKVTDDDGTLYELKLDNGFEIDFDKDGNWTDIEGNRQQVPDALIPEGILSYVLSNYPSPLFIEGIDKESYGYQLEISNDLDLKFDVDGNFIGIDD